MCLIWKKYDSEFNPILMVVGAAFLVGGVSVLAQIAHALGDPVVWYRGPRLIAALMRYHARSGIPTLEAQGTVLLPRVSK